MWEGICNSDLERYELSYALYKILTRDFSTCGKLGFKLEILTSLNSLEAVDVLFFWPFPVQSFWIVLIGFETLGA